jgi:hypothetical protein
MATRHPLANHPEHVEALGMIAIETVALELELASLLSRILMVRRRVAEAIFLTPKAESARLDVLENVAKAAFALRSKVDPESELEKQKADALQKVLRIVERSRKAIGKRHRAMHDEWDARGDFPVIQRFPVDGRPASKGTPVRIIDLRQQIKELRALIDDVIDLANEFDRTKPLMVSLQL